MAGLGGFLFGREPDHMTLRVAHQDFEGSRMDRDINKSEREIRIEEVGANSLNLDLSRQLVRSTACFMVPNGYTTR